MKNKIKDIRDAKYSKGDKMSKGRIKNLIVKMNGTKKWRRNETSNDVQRVR